MRLACKFIFGVGISISLCKRLHCLRLKFFNCFCAVGLLQHVGWRRSVVFSVLASINVVNQQCTYLFLLKTFKVLNGLLCADVPLRNYSLTHPHSES